MTIINNLKKLSIGSNTNIKFTKPKVNQNNQQINFGSNNITQVAAAPAPVAKSADATSTGGDPGSCGVQ